MENPCACTALQELAALSTNLQTEAPWDDLASAAYCQTASLYVDCTPVGGVQLPTEVSGIGDGLAGALPPSLEELGPSVTKLQLANNDITSVPTEIGALTGLTRLRLDRNAITSLPTEIGALTSLVYAYLHSNNIASVPSELGALTNLEGLYMHQNDLAGVPAVFQTFAPSAYCFLSDDDPGFSCANAGFGTSCCTADNRGDTSTCYGSPCAYTDTTCAAGSTCPGGTAVSAACADRSAFAENPCACTALQELAALSTNLQTEAPWDDLASASYCTGGLVGDYDYVFPKLEVKCATSGGVQVPVRVTTTDEDLTGALPPSLGDLGPSLTELHLGGNAITSVPTELGALAGLEDLVLPDTAITSVPTELGALTGLTFLNLDGNALTSLPTELGALTDLVWLYLFNNALTSVPTEIGALTALTFLDLQNDQLTGVPSEFRTVDPSPGYGDTICVL